MANEKIAIKEQLTALVMRPRSIQRTHKQIDLNEGAESQREISESMETEKKDATNP